MNKKYLMIFILYILYIIKTMEFNLSKKEQVKIVDSSFTQSSFTQPSFMQSYSYNKSTDKLEAIKRKLRTQNYFEEDNDINIIYPSTK